MVRDSSSSTACAALTAVSLLQSCGLLFCIHVHLHVALAIKLTVLTVIAIGADWQFLQVIRVHLVARKVIVLLGLFFVLLVDFGLNIDELVAPLLAPTLARGLTLLSISVPIALAGLASSHLHIVVLVLFIIFILLVFFILLLAALLIILALLLGILVHSRGS